MTQQLAQLCSTLGIVALHSVWQMAILAAIYRGVALLFRQESAAIRYQFALSMYYLGSVWMLLTWASVWSGDHLGSTWLNVIHQGIAWEQYLLIVAGIAYVAWISMAAIRFAHLQQLRGKQPAGTIKIPVELKLLVQQLRERMEIRSSITIRMTHVHQVPGVEGWIKPVLLLPISLLSPLNLKQWEAILIHELAHIKRNDFFHYQFTHGLHIFMGFNPFARFLLKEVDITREMACDEWVVNFGHAPTGYAQTLLQLEYQRLERDAVPALAATKGKPALMRRVEHMHVHAGGINPNPNWMQRTLQLGTTFVLLLGFLVGVPFWASTQWGSETSTTTTSQDRRVAVNPLERMRWISAPLARNLPEQTMDAPKVVSTPAAKKANPTMVPTRVKSTSALDRPSQSLPADEDLPITSYINRKLLDVDRSSHILPVKQTDVRVDANGKKWILMEVQESGSSQKIVMWLEATPGENDIRVEPLYVEQKSVQQEASKKADSTKQATTIKPRKRAI